MMTFFTQSNGQETQVQATFEMGGGSIQPIPNDTGCVAAIEEAKWDEYNGDRFIVVKWRVQQPGDYANRVIFQKIKIFGTEQCKDKTATSDKAKRMLVAIDTNAGGKLVALGREPTDSEMAVSLVGKIMGVKVMLWEINGKTGNWIGAVSPVKGGAATKAKVEAAKVAPSQAASLDEDDVPF